MKWIESLTGNYSSSARVVDGTLIISLPQALTPIVWRMELGHVRSSALEVRQLENNTFMLVLKTPRGDVNNIAPFDSRGRAVQALMAVSRAMEQAHGQITPPAANNTASSAGVTNLPAIRPTARPATKGRFATSIVATVLLLGLVAVFLNMGSRNNSAMTNGHESAAASHSAAAPQTGVPLSADDFLNNR
jgi:hypothetical protein